jgi:hypothetical protein
MGRTARAIARAVRPGPRPARHWDQAGPDTGIRGLPSKCPGQGSASRWTIDRPKTGVGAAIIAGPSSSARPNIANGMNSIGSVGASPIFALRQPSSRLGAMPWRRATMGTPMPKHPVQPAAPLAGHRSRCADARPAPSLRLRPLRSLLSDVRKESEEEQNQATFRSPQPGRVLTIAGRHSLGLESGPTVPTISRSHVSYVAAAISAMRACRASIRYGLGSTLTFGPTCTPSMSARPEAKMMRSAG